MPKKVVFKNVSKHFGGIYALDNVSMGVNAGEILGLVGENGAGKSTLVKILTGAYTPDAGEIEIGGKNLRINNPAAGRKAGIGVIYQEFALANDLTVATNIYLHKINERFLVKQKEINLKSEKIINRLGFNINPNALVGNLSVAHKQVVEIAKALSEDVEILILDEPTTVLPPTDVKKLHALLNVLKNEGTSIIYVSHRLEEIFAITDRVTVLKDGKLVGTEKTANVDMDKLINMMIGRGLSSMFPLKNVSSEELVFEAKNLNKQGVFKNISFQVRKGEIFGFSGLVGSGRTETMKAIFGADGGYDSGEIFLQGKKIYNRNVTCGVKNGIGYIPEDRKEEGIVLNESVRNNISFTILKELTTYLAIIKKKKETSLCKNQVNNLNINTPTLETEAYNLSGGNQQKVVLAKWFAKDSKLVIFDEPARGVDVGAKVEIYNLISNLAKEGVGVIVISSEMIEILGLCNRIAVMCEGEIAGILNSNEMSEESIMQLSVRKGMKNGTQKD